MKRFLVVFLGVLSLGVAVNAWGLKIGYVDIHQVFDQCPYTEEATETLNREMEERNVKIRTYQKEIEKLKEELKEMPELIEGKIKRQKDIISKKEDELKKFAEESGKRLIQREQELTLEIT
ncbi:MAG: OmpH family outer membrane protein, partial [bacterium]|nr:OmpH family outer membrane protein [bacterium]